MRKLIQDIKLLKFLVVHEKSYRNLSGIIITTTATIVFALLQFDFSNLITAEIIKPKTTIILLQLVPKVVLIIGLIALFILNRIYIKKWRNIRSLSSDDLKKLNRYL